MTGVFVGSRDRAVLWKTAHHRTARAPGDVEPVQAELFARCDL